MGQWGNFFSVKRIRPSSSGQSSSDRSDFHRDFDRIVFSSAFRSLQQKTQVIPFPKTDFVHSRLTHSLETASVGRSLGVSVCQKLQEKEVAFREEMAQLQLSPVDFGAVVAAAALSHDMGNPPFGHSGEDAISLFFQSGKGAGFIEALSKEEKMDFQRFEGNAMGLRMLCHTPASVSAMTGGLNLTFATLGAFMKYPCLTEYTDKTLGKASRKKYGVFHSEQALFEQMFKDFGLLKEQGYAQRHPLAFLTEAADDICYHIIDLEDGTRLGWLSLADMEGLVAPFMNEKAWRSYEQLYDPTEKAGYLRAISINKLVAEVSELFTEQLDGILSGSFDRPLCDEIASAPDLSRIKKESIDRIYNHPSVVETEVAGYTVLQHLLEVFGQALLDSENLYSRKLLKMMPQRFSVRGEQSAYETMMTLLEFICSMSDKSSMALYRQLKGI